MTSIGEMSWTFGVFDSTCAINRYFREGKKKKFNESQEEKKTSTFKSRDSMTMIKYFKHHTSVLSSLANDAIDDVVAFEL